MIRSRLFFYGLIWYLSEPIKLTYRVSHKKLCTNPAICVDGISQATRALVSSNQGKRWGCESFFITFRYTFTFSAGVCENIFSNDMEKVNKGYIPSFHISTHMKCNTQVWAVSSPSKFSFSSKPTLWVA